MTTFYAGRHRAVRTTRSTTTRRAGAGVLAASALSLGVTGLTATGASANAIGPSGESAPAPTSTQSTSTPSSSFTDYVRRGDQGVIVKQIQQIVGVTQDGAFGPETEAGVIAWQTDNGLAADGIVGPKTGSAMGLEGGAATGSTSGGATSGSTTGDSTASATTVSTSDAGTADSGILATAASLVGTPYVYGGESPGGFDCSGFTQYVFAQNGISLPRVTTDQQAATTPVSDPQPGDLVFFGSPAYHVGIYAGDGMMYDSGSTGSTVTKRAIWTDNVTYGRL